MRKGTSALEITVKSFVTILIFLFLGGTYAFAAPEVEGETSNNTLKVTAKNRDHVTSSPGVPSLSPRPSPAGPSDIAHEAGGSSASGGQSNSQAAAQPRTLRERCTGPFRIVFGVEQCLGQAALPPGEPAPPPQAAAPEAQVVNEPVTITITESDLLELIPESPQILMDRGPFGLKNAYTNFYASHHEPQTVTRTMFDQEVTITATPIEYRWDYGNGETLVTDLPGYPVDEFNTETDTSHQYDETGLYTVQLTTVFEGTYQVDGGEVQNVSSTVTQQAEPTEIRIWRAVTRNVDQTCLENPSAWGCEGL